MSTEDSYLAVIYTDEYGKLKREWMPYSKLLKPGVVVRVAGEMFTFTRSGFWVTNRFEPATPSEFFGCIEYCCVELVANEPTANLKDLAYGVCVVAGGTAYIHVQPRVWVDEKGLYHSEKGFEAICKENDYEILNPDHSKAASNDV